MMTYVTYFFVGFGVTLFCLMAAYACYATFCFLLHKAGLSP